MEMSVTTNTGGLKQFGYGVPSYDPDFEDRIDKIYEKIRIKKKLNKFLESIIIGIILIIFGGIFIYYKAYYFAGGFIIVGLILAYNNFSAIKNKKHLRGEGC